MKKLFGMLAFVLVSASAMAQSPLNVQVPITYAEGVSPPERVKAECSVENYLQAALEANLSRRNSVNFSGASSTGRSLRVQIINIDAIGGGGWTGAKTLAVRAELLQDGTVLRKSGFSRSSRGGAAGAFAGTCSMLNRCAEALGRDVTKWVSDPRYQGQDTLEEPGAKPTSDAPAPPTAPATNN